MGKIYVASLAAYNAGALHGEWIEPTDDVDEMWLEIEAMLKSSPVPGEEWAVHDYEDFPNLGEYPSLAELAQWAGLLDEFDHDINIVFAARECWNAFEDVSAAVHERFAGAYDSAEEWAEEYLMDTGTLAGVPESLRNYIDFKAWARDQDTYETRIDGNLYIFWSY